ncbi:uncharacterized protein FYW47_010621 [Aplochiton taeniatus]
MGLGQAYVLNMKAVSVPSVRVARQTGPGLYRLATICLATLCAVLLVSIIAVSAHYKKIDQSSGSGETASGEVQKQTQEVNVTILTEALRKLQQVKDNLQRERDELLAKLSKADTGTVVPPVIGTTVRSPPQPATCPSDWVTFNSSCYFISTGSNSWPDSQAYCQRFRGHLAIIHTAEEQTFLWDLLPRGHWNAYWFGISDETTEEEWKWVDGTPLVGGFWEDGEPNNHIDEDCGYIIKTRKLERVPVKSWYDAPCSMHWPFICEKEIVGVK